MKKLIILLLCCFLFGCREYAGIRICKKNTNDCVVYPNRRYITNLHWNHINEYCDRHSDGKATIEDIKNPKVFEVFTCNDYDFYPVWSR